MTWVQDSDSPSNREGVKDFGAQRREPATCVGDDVGRVKADLAAGQGEGILYRMLAIAGDRAFHAVFVRRIASRIVHVAIGVAGIACLGAAQSASLEPEQSSFHCRQPNGKLA
ncbi:MAG TPA: hypothetical protein VLI40_03495 [Gemmatimonadaceae bacterium]|nr:hypothetical protein [Gemmatimonadaceae bacterium]